MNPVILRLFVTGNTKRSRAAVQRVTELCETYPTGAVSLDIVDVLETPQLAETDRVLATPTLVRLMPFPSVRIVGDMSDSDMLQRILESTPTLRYVM